MIDHAATFTANLRMSFQGKRDKVSLSLGGFGKDSSWLH